MEKAGVMIVSLSSGWLGFVFPAENLNIFVKAKI
jgi:hypothetical protein